MIAIGIGCRLGCPASAIEALVRQALDLAASAGPARLFTIEDKAGESGLRLAADRLCMDLGFLSREVLAAQSAFIRTRSEGAERRFGIPSVAEAAALSGSGAGSVLIVPRITGMGATCAVAGPAS
jgi:cobalt-precorrin 5A hydrolase